MSLLEKPVTTFMDELASNAPAPGGGSVAALSGAMGAALVSMVCNLTIGKKKYAEVEEDIQGILGQSEELRLQLQGLVADDIEVYTNVIAAYRLPRGTEEEKAARTAAIQEALKKAEAVPMRVAEACVEVMDLCRPAGDKGNINAVSDAGVAVLMAEAGLRSAALNVLINLGAIRDEAFVAAERAKLDALLAGKGAMRDDVYDFVVGKL
jgi:formiminotetrahydrofolate cyclodeaminase